ncbi:hypothetical protein ERO13_A11G065600v2 [Gossypium hirsutum]|uniref:Uncharacterized protein n=3 Tax=Gossypium TaxID=3633 RepID=A0A1U8L3J5_GOSHI|nr:uncharacterized protein LOC107923538 [Gossypium hirsutum]KAB2055977.1 hypothetical protein ES319_A11G073200v1 [Gossypium barbadense]KAG4173550.1 hypothetical protein ERO13_A11G065600v2 [Gossypium hirsutum]TYG92994.1 hypothetical protein ES288_A11G076100v1 [Gossypium darwinii]
MKREAPQQGVVRTYPVHLSPWNPKPKTRSVQTLDSLPVSGSFSTVTPKASNHSKFSGKCGRLHCVECHLNPVSKSKDKSKGTQKFRTCNLAGFKFSGFSATGVLEYLYSFNDDDDDDEIGNHVNDHDYVYEDVGTYVLNDNDDNDDFLAKFWSLHDKQNDDDDDDDDTSYCDVDFMLDIEEDEGWCLLREL